MGKGLCGLIAGVFASVFVGSFACELFKKTEIARRVSNGVQSAKNAFKEGYESVEEKAPRKA